MKLIYAYTIAPNRSIVKADFEAVYDEVEPNKHFTYTMPDGRQVKVTFYELNHKTTVKVNFDAETENSLEMQKEGWQSILDNFKKYTESN